MPVFKSLISNCLPVKELIDPWEIRLGNKTEFILLNTLSQMLKSYHIKFLFSLFFESLCNGIYSLVWNSDKIE